MYPHPLQRRVRVITAYMVNAVQWKHLQLDVVDILEITFILQKL